MKNTVRLNNSSDILTDSTGCSASSSWWMLMVSRSGRIVLMSQDCGSLQATSLVPPLPLGTWLVWNLTNYLKSLRPDWSGLCNFFLGSLDNHDIVSMKLYELTIQRNSEDEEEEEVTIPRVDNMEQFQGSKMHDCIYHRVHSDCKLSEM